MTDEKSDNDVEERISEDSETVCASYFWGGLVRIDIFAAPLSIGLVFFGAPALKVHALPLLHTKAPGTQEDVNKAVLKGKMMDKAVTTRFPDINESSLDPSLDEDESSGHSDSATDELGEETSKGVDHPSDSGKGEESGAAEFFGGDAVLERGGLVAAKRFEIECFGLEEEMADISISGLPGWVSIVAKRRRDRGVLRGCVWAPKGIEVFVRTPIPIDNPLRDS